MRLEQNNKKWVVQRNKSMFASHDWFGYIEEISQASKRLSGIIVRVLQCLYQYNIPDVNLEGVLEKIQGQMAREWHCACREKTRNQNGKIQGDFTKVFFLKKFWSWKHRSCIFTWFVAQINNWLTWYFSRAQD